jgi:hypothetical protein
MGHGHRINVTTLHCLGTYVKLTLIERNQDLQKHARPDLMPQSFTRYLLQATTLLGTIQLGNMANV